MTKEHSKETNKPIVHEDILEELLKIAEVDPILKKALEAWEEISTSEEHIATYNKRLKELDEQNKGFFPYLHSLKMNDRILLVRCLTIDDSSF